MEIGGEFLLGPRGTTTVLPPGTIRGRVVDVKLDQETPRQGLQLFGLGSQQRPIPILRFRIETEDGRAVQIQYKGDRRGDLVVNDIVQVRGRQSGGVVMASRIYNETLDAVIAQSGGCLLALLMGLTYWLH